MKHLIRNACVITVNAAGEVFDPGYVVMDGPCIVSAGLMADVPPGPFDQITDAAGAFVCPGLINLHQHVHMNMIKGMADGMRLEHWSAGLSAKSRNAMTWDDFLASWRLGALEMLRTGTTTFFNHGLAYGSPGGEDQAVALFRAAGIRHVVGLMYQIRTPALPDHPFGPAEADAWLRGLQARLDDRTDHMTRIAAVVECNAHHTKAGRSSDELVRAGAALARDLDMRVASHMSGGSLSMSFGFTYYKRFTGRSDVEYLHQLGVLDDRWMLIHGIHFTDQDMDLIAQAGAAVVYTPTSESMRGGGIGPWVQMRERGIFCALGSDGPAVDYSVDMLEQAKATVLFQALRYRRAAAVTPDTALRMATIWAARTVGMEDIIGSIEPGKRADLVIFARDRASQVLTDDPVAALVMATHGADARMVLVNGAVVYDHGRYAEGIDAESIVAEARARSARVLAETGLESRSAPVWPPRAERAVAEKWL